MDRITESLLAEFSREHELDRMQEDKRFEHFCSFITVRRHFSEMFETEDIVVGEGGDTGIDGIAIIVNGSLITDLEMFNDQTNKAGSLDVSFIFVQAERSSNFDSTKIGSLGYGVIDFFKDNPTLQRNDKVKDAAEIMKAIYKHSSKFKRGNPICRLYYATTGKWVNDRNLEGRINDVVGDLKATTSFRDVEFTPIDAENLHKLYRQTRNAISREFVFTNKTVMPEIQGVKEAYLGFLPAKEFLKLLTDENGEMLRVLFYDNVRDWLDFNDVNNEIKDTLENTKSRFVLMNNGVTIIARNLQLTANKFLIEDYSIVNGCQTSNVLFDQRDKIIADENESVMIPVRLIGTQDEEVIKDIVKGTNRQTEVKEDQFYALQDFSKELESYFKTYEDPYKLYYERRFCQYAGTSVEKTRVVTTANMIKAFAAMFLNEPHRTTRNYSGLKGKVGSDIFAKGHKMEPYYAAAFALYKLRNLATRYRPARFHILLATRLLSSELGLPQMNSHEMARYSQNIIDILWDNAKSEELFSLAIEVVDAAAAGDYHRDNIRTDQFTNKIIDNCLSRRSSGR